MFTDRPTPVGASQKEQDALIAQSNPFSCGAIFLLPKGRRNWNLLIGMECGQEIRVSACKVQSPPQTHISCVLLAV